MFNRYPTISNEALGALRACNLFGDEGSYTEECEASPDFGITRRFVRCAGTLDRPRLGLDRQKLDEIAANIRAATGDEAQRVLVSWHPKYGDYLQVSTASKAYQFLCYLKS